MTRPKGEDHHQWKGDEASYSAFHFRVVAAKGRPQKCEECGTTEGKMCWCNLTGDYDNVDDYKRMCRSCHQRMDCARRIETKEMTSPRNSGVFRHANRCILTEEQVLEAKELKFDGWTWEQLGRRYGVVPNTVRSAVKGKNWSHLKGRV